MLESASMDFRVAIRGLLADFRLTGLVVLVLALGLGGATAMFSVVKGVLLEPLAYESADELVAIFRQDRDLNQKRNPTTPADFLDWREGARSLEDMTAAHPWAPSLTGRESPTRLSGLKASVSLFRLLRAEPALGRVFVPETGSPSDEVVVLSHALWTRQFGGDETLIGETLLLDGEPFTVIGVMPEGFAFPPFWATDAEFWTPLVLDADEAANRRSQYLRVFARLSPGFDVERARSELTAIASRLESAYPETNRGASVTLESLKEPVVGGARRSLLILLGAVGLLLLVACANVAHLLMTRAASLRRDVALRLALGADRTRVARGFVVEGLLLSVAGGLAGLVFATWTLSVLRWLGAQSIPRLESAALDANVFFFALCLSAVTGLAFSVAPTLTASRTRLVTSLKTDQGFRTRAGHVLVVGEVSLALVLLIGAGLLIRSYEQLRSLDPGFSRRALLTIEIPLAGSQHEAPERQLQLFEQLDSQIRSLPGIEALALVNHLPIGGDIWQTPFVTDSQEPIAQPPRASFRTVSSHFFETVGARIERGRPFHAGDVADGPPVVIINRTLADRFFSGRDPIGRRIRTGSDEGDPWLTVVGVVSDLRQWTLREEVKPEIFFPYRQNPVSWWTTTTLVVSSEREPEELSRSIRSRVWELDPNLPLAEPRSIESILANDMGAPRLQSWVLTLFALNAIILAAVGIFGVVSHLVEKRKWELAVRLALGASPRSLLLLALREGVWLTLAGSALGTSLALVTSRLLSSLLFGIAASDAVTFFGLAFLVVAIGILASYLPARRAAALSPATALRTH